MNTPTSPDPVVLDPETVAFHDARRVAQGLPPTIQDSTILRRTGLILAAAPVVTADTRTA